MPICSNFFLIPFFPLTVVSKLKIQLYLYFQTVLSEDADNQKKGVVSVAIAGENHASISKLPSTRDRFRLARFIQSAPVRYCAIHSCHPDTPMFRLIRAAYSLGINSSESTKYRLRFHIGMYSHPYHMRHACREFISQEIYATLTFCFE